MINSILNWLLYFIPGFLLTGLIIFIHELGHYFASKIVGVNVEVLSFGFGKTIFSYMGKNTEFRISLIPFGGYCRLSGSEDLTLALQNNKKHIKYAEDGSLFGVSALKKFFIYLSGPLTNFILAFILLIFVSSYPVERISNKAYVAPSSLYPELFNVHVEQDNIENGDLVLKADGKEIIDYEDLSSYLDEVKGKDVELTLLRNEEVITVVIKPTLIDDSYYYGLTNYILPIIGRSESELFRDGDIIEMVNGVNINSSLDLLSISAEEYDFTLIRDGERVLVKYPSASFPFAFNSEYRISPDSTKPVSLAYKRLISITTSTIKAISKLLSFHFDEALSVISGPFTSAHTIGRISFLAFESSINSGLRTIMYLLSIVSISVCIGNLIPIPTFDGGQMLIAFVEIIVRKTLKPKTYLILHISGMVAAWTIVIIMNTWSFLPISS